MPDSIPALRAHCVDRAANSGLTGSETGNRGPRRGQRAGGATRARRQGTARGQTDGGKSQISQTETAGRSSSKTAGTIRKERGDLGNRRWKEQWPEKRQGRDGGCGGGGPGRSQMEAREGSHRQGEEFD